MHEKDVTFLGLRELWLVQLYFGHVTDKVLDPGLVGFHALESWRNGRKRAFKNIQVPVSMNGLADFQSRERLCSDPKVRNVLALKRCHVLACKVRLMNGKRRNFFIQVQFVCKPSQLVPV